MLPLRMKLEVQVMDIDPPPVNRHAVAKQSNLARILFELNTKSFSLNSNHYNFELIEMNA